MESKKSNTRMLVAIVILIMIIIFGGILFTLSSMGYLNFDKGELIESNNKQTNSENNETKLTEAEALTIGKELYDKATEIYETWVLLPYCGIHHRDIKDQDIETLGDSDYGNGSYYKSKFSSFDELKNHLKQWLSEDIINDKVVKSYVWNGETYYEYVEDISLLFKQDTHYGYVDYVLKGDNLYCRLDTGKGWLTYYLNDYDLSVEKIDNNTIVYNVKSAYANYKAQENNSKCLSGNIKDCKEDEIEYKDTTFVIEKNESNNWVVLKYQLHD